MGRKGEGMATVGPTGKMALPDWGCDVASSLRCLLPLVALILAVNRRRARENNEREREEEREWE